MKTNKFVTQFIISHDGAYLFCTFIFPSYATQLFYKILVTGYYWS